MFRESIGTHGRTALRPCIQRPAISTAGCVERLPHIPATSSRDRLARSHTETRRHAVRCASLLTQRGWARCVCRRRLPNPDPSPTFGGEPAVVAPLSPRAWRLHPCRTLGSAGCVPYWALRIADPIPGSAPLTSPGHFPGFASRLMADSSNPIGSGSRVSGAVVPGLTSRATAFPTSRLVRAR